VLDGGEARGARARAGRLALGFFLVIFAFYGLSGPGHSTSADGSLMMQSARNLIRSGTTAVPQYAELTRKGPDGRDYAKFGPGMVLAHVPVLWLAGHLESLRPTVDGRRVSSIDRDAFFAPFTNAALMAAAVCGIALCGVALGFPLGACFTLAGFMAVASPLWLYARSDSSEALQSASLIGAVYLLLRNHRRPGAADLLGCGTLLGVAIATKSLNVIVVPCFLAFALRRSATRKSRAVLCVVAPVAIAGVLLAAFNQARFGSPLETGYGLAPRLFGHPLFDGAATQLFSMGHGLLIFCPTFLLLPLAAREMARRFPAESALLAAIFATYLVAFSKWWAYWGMNWGPRFLIPTVPLLALGLLPLFGRGSTTKVTLVAALLLGAIGQGIAATTSYWDQVMPVWMLLAPPQAVEPGADPKMKDVGLWNHYVHQPALAPLRVASWWLRNASCQDAEIAVPPLSTPPWATHHPSTDPERDTVLLGELRGLDFWVVPECRRLRFAPPWSPQNRMPIPSNPPLAWALLAVAALGCALVASAWPTSPEPGCPSGRSPAERGQAGSRLARAGC